ncbi:MAG: type VI secretion system membrane subunit TssM, partial [Pseudomonadota bacterium]|nr:type VI secretion system membrane subunit TssM [Pseudomonadota bacterium]
MKRLLRPFGQPWLLSLLGVSALAVIVWVLGPSLAFNGRAFLEPPWARAAAVLAIFGLWGLNRARVYALARYRSRRLQAGLQRPAADPSPAAARADIDAIQAKFADALQALKKHLGRRFGGRYLYELPWYIIMGRSRSGKTTALANAGLNFFRKTPGSGETRDCDWFLTSEAVLLDTAGHLATQDRQQAVDSATWQGFLRLVRKYRPRRPINGVLVAVSAADLLELAEAGRSALAQTLKERLQELHEGLGIRFPVYVLVTKCDRIAGFMEFFAKLGAQERAQIWGMTLPLYERLDTPVQRLLDDFNDHFTALEQRLREQLLPRLHAERRDQARDLIFAFPQQFAALRPRLEEFLHPLFQPNLRRETPLLRGVYFTSGTQVGSPIDQVTAALAGVFGISRQTLPAFSGPGKSYFITGLLREVVFAEAGLANTNLRLERYRRWLHRGAAAAAAAAAVLLGVAWGISYQNNAGYVAAVDRAAQAVQEKARALAPDADVLAVLPLLDAAWDIPGGYGERDAPRPWGRGFGLDQTPKLGAQGAVPAYQELLDAALKPRLQRLLETGLMQDQTSDLATLKTYLLLGGEHFDAEGGAIVGWWSRHPRNADPDWRAMTRHIQALVDYLAGHDGRFITLDEAVVRQARGRLDRLDPGAWLYGEWRRTCLEGGVADFDLGQAVGRDNALVFTSARTPFVLDERVPGCFTRDGHAAFYPTADTVEALRRKHWVLAAGTGSAGEGARLTRQVQRLYLQDYAGQWRDLLENLAISQLSSDDLERSVGIARILANPEASPLLKLLEAVVSQT